MGVVSAILPPIPNIGPTAAIRDRTHWIVATQPTDVLMLPAPECFEELDRLAPGFWAGWLTFDAGRTVEGLPARSSEPALVLARFASIRRMPVEIGITDLVPQSAATPLRWDSSLDNTQWLEAVTRIHGYERAGDCYQVNLTRRLALDSALPARALFASVAEYNPAPHSALLEFRDFAGASVVSASPECFLQIDGRNVRTRPIKGTAASATTLLRSTKDRNENTMIVDLARNDLGRVCEFGTVQTTELCSLEAHPNVFHLVSTVSGRLRSDVGIGTLLAATSPPASITGAPKPRVLQIIDALEPVTRGIYCGAIGWIDTHAQRSEWNVAIRTFTITATETHFGVGAGITIDSDAQAEWEETELKASRLLNIASTLLEYQQ
ncbi:MAG: anthranilate synthase component I family protein [Acidimicrobiia bacterium]